MCIAMTGKIIEINGQNGKVDFGGNILDINLGLVSAVEGQYVLVHAGCAIEIMEKDKAQELMDIFEEITGDHQQ